MFCSVRVPLIDFFFLAMMSFVCYVDLNYVVFVIL